MRHGSADLKLGSVTDHCFLCLSLVFPCAHLRTSSNHHVSLFMLLRGVRPVLMPTLLAVNLNRYSFDSTRVIQDLLSTFRNPIFPFRLFSSKHACAGLFEVLA